MTDQLNSDFEFRVCLLEIQDCLSDTDRRQLNFVFGDEIPRRLQADGSISTALEALQTLFDRAKLSANNYDYLIRGLQAIQRQDCVDKLRSTM
jgi:hypothetical protein